LTLRDLRHSCVAEVFEFLLFQNRGMDDAKLEILMTQPCPASWASDAHKRFGSHFRSESAAINMVIES
jgi:hypothetical protein